MQNKVSLLGSALMKAMEDVKKDNTPKAPVISKEKRKQADKIAAEKSQEKERARAEIILKQRNLFMQNNTNAINAQVSGVKIMLMARAAEMEFQYHLTDFKGFGKAKQLSKRIQTDIVELVKEIQRNGIVFKTDLYSEDNYDDDAGELWDFIHTLFMIGFYNMKETIAIFKTQLPEHEKVHKDRVKAMAEEATEADLKKWIKKYNI